MEYIIKNNINTAESGSAIQTFPKREELSSVPNDSSWQHIPFYSASNKGPLVISASRRCDIPANHMPWFMNRVREGYCISKSPRNNKSIFRIDLRPENVAAFDFWTKDPRPLIPHLDELDRLGHRYLVKFTITGLPKIFEPNVPDTNLMLETFKELRGRVGQEQIAWRYDPLLPTSSTDLEYHKKRFAKLAAQLSGHVKYVYFSLLCEPPAVKKRLRGLSEGIELLDIDYQSSEFGELMVSMAETARSHGMELKACTCEHDFSHFGIEPAACTDGELIQGLWRIKPYSPKNYKLRENCNCILTVDIGAYGICNHGCKYCYADRTPEHVSKNQAAHDLNSPMLIGWPDDYETDEFAQSEQTLDDFSNCPMSVRKSGCNSCPSAKECQLPQPITRDKNGDWIATHEPDDELPEDDDAIAKPVTVASVEPAKPIESFDGTDLGNAKRFAQKFGEGLRYSPMERRWYQWHECKWQVSSWSQVRTLSFDLIHEMQKQVRKSPAEQAEQLEQHAAKLSNFGKMDAMLKMVSSLPQLHVHAHTFDQHQNLLCMKNGVYDFNKMEFRDHRPKDFSTKVAGIAYDEQATCPKWNQFISDCFNGNAGLIRYFYRATGRALIEGNKDQVLHFFHGPGATGKSTVINVLVELMRDYACTADADAFSKGNQSAARSSLARLKSSRLVSLSEHESNKPLAESMVKTMVGGDKVAARMLWNDFIEFRPQFHLFWAVNKLPQISNFDSAMGRRLRVIPFKYVVPFASRDNELLGKLLAELPGIFNQLLEGHRDWDARGLDEPAEITAATNYYRATHDSVGVFVEQCCNTKQLDAETPVSELHEVYSRWCREQRLLPRHLIVFGKELVSLGFTQERNSKTRYWVGIRLAA